MIQVMTANPPTGETNVAASLRALVRNLKRRCLIVLISDLQSGAEISNLQSFDWPKGVQLKIEAIKAQQAQIDELKSIIRSL
mgnify:CR=1 FL=1